MDYSGPVVLIDDDQDDQELISALTKEILVGHDIRNFYNGSDALQYLITTEDQPFLIICDMNMPVMNGLELLKAIQDDHFLKSKSIPFIFLSTAADHRSVKQSYELGVQGFFKKPDTIQKLREVLQLTYSFWQTCLHPNHKNFKK